MNESLSFDVESLVELVEGAAKWRNNSLVPINFIVEALSRIKNGTEEVDNSYPFGPSLKGTYNIAMRIYQESKRN